MGRIFLTTLLAAVVGGALAVAGTAGGTSSGTPAPAAFRLADGSVGCAFDGARLACRSRGGSTAVVLESSGSSQAEDVEVSWDDSTRVLLAAESWWHGGFNCHVAYSDVVCESGPGSIAVGPAAAGGASSAVSP